MNNQTLPYNETDIESGKFHLYMYPEIKSHLQSCDIDLPITYEYVEFKNHRANQQSYLVKTEERHEQKFVFFDFYFVVHILFDFKNNCFQIDVMIPEKYPHKSACTIRGARAIRESIDNLTKIQ